MKILPPALALVLSCMSLATAANEPFRPAFHYTPEKNWMNDPNGMVYLDGEYHLFYQYNPEGDKWGHMSWGHAISTDLVHWREMPLALAEADGEMIFSGSAVVDWKNTSGFGRDGQPPLVAIYTGHREGNQSQCLAYSTDKGRTWTKYSGNPVLDLHESDFRDPKVFWHAPTKRWIMAVALSLQRKILFFSSPDLKSWTKLSEFGPAGATTGIWECPDLFPLPIEGAPGKQRWALLVNVGSGAPAGGSGCQYFTGSFDGKRFIADPVPPARPAKAPAGKVLADFEGPSYAPWTVEGNAFGERPASRPIAGQNPVKGFLGRGFVNGFHGGDDTQGILTSPPFRIDADHLSFLIGGGSHAGATCMNLLVDGKIARTAAGNDDETLDWKSWDVSDLRGQTARLEIIDRQTGPWGHVNVDQIVLGNDRPLPARDGGLWADFGPDYYATVTWSDIPEQDGRRIAIGWMSNWDYANDVPTSPWRGAMTVARELGLRPTPAGLRLVQKPVRELEKMRGKPRQHQGGTLAELNEWLAGQTFAAPVEIVIEWPSTADAGLRLAAGDAEMTVRSQPARGKLFVDRTKSGLTNFHAKFPGVYEAEIPTAPAASSLRLLVDRSSLEVLANDGIASITSLVFPPNAPLELQLLGSPETPIQSFMAWELARAPTASQP